MPRPAQLKRLVQAGQQFVCHSFCLRGGFMQVAAEVFKHHDKLVATKTGHGIGFAHAGHQPRCHLGQQLIAHVMAQGVVQVLKLSRSMNNSAPWALVRCPATMARCRRSSNKRRLGRPVSAS